jgi:hypothetical protein
MAMTHVCAAITPLIPAQAAIPSSENWVAAFTGSGQWDQFGLKH